jgi:hypothetical protein
LFIEFIACVSDTYTARSCPCVDDCKTVSYSPSISASSISKNGIEEYSVHRRGVQNRYHNAAEVSNRADGVEFQRTVAVLHSVSVAYDTLLQLVNKYIFNETTNLPCLIKLYTTTVDRLIAHDWREPRELIEGLMSNYTLTDVYFEALNSQLRTLCKSIVSANLHTANGLQHSYNVSQQIDETKLLIHGIRTIIANSTLHGQLRRPFTDQECQPYDFSSILIDLENLQKTSTVDISDANKFETSAVHRLSTISRCLFKYRIDLEEFSAWLDRQKLLQHATLSVSPLELHLFDDDHKWLQNVATRYSSGTTTKRHIANLFLTGMRSQQVLASVDRLVDQIETSVISPIERFLETRQADVLSYYAELNTKRFHLVQHITNDDEDALSFLNDWFTGVFGSSIVSVC